VETLKLLGSAFDSTGRIMANVSTDSLGMPTPCPDWDVRALINHTTGVVKRFESVAARQEPRADVPDDLVGDEPVVIFERAADATLAAWSAPGALDGSCRLPMGLDVPAELAAGINLTDTLVHGWDLAQATGQVPTLDPAVANAALEISKEFMTDAFRGPGNAFALLVPVSEDASPTDHLVAYLGRHP
jgi:uncharacterized protein (TIGR03086 family)